MYYYIEKVNKFINLWFMSTLKTILLKYVLLVIICTSSNCHIISIINIYVISINIKSNCYKVFLK